MSNQHSDPYNSSFATIILDYKSGQRHVHNVTVSDARKRAKDAIARKSCRWIKVVIPKPDSNQEIVCIWEPRTQWSRKEVEVPTANTPF